MADDNHKSQMAYWNEILGSARIPFGIAAGLNRLEGISTYRKFGQNPGITTSFEDMWAPGGDYTFSTSAETVNIVSTDTNDTSAGTGAQTITIYGLDSNYLEISEVITLNGTTNVISSNSYIRMHSLKATTAGTGGTNIGAITATQTTSGDVMAYMVADTGTTHQLIYTVPGNKTLTADRMNLSVTKGDDVAFELQFRPLGGAWQVIFHTHAFEGISEFNLCHGIVFQPKTDIKLRCKRVSGSGAEATGVIDGYLFTDDHYYTDTD